jgi:hypothetical protein
MTEYQLGAILKEMYDNAPKGEQVAHIHLFGIKYAQVIADNDLSIKQILVAAHLNQSYCTEISKGMKLSKFVEIKD